MKPELAAARRALMQRIAACENLVGARPHPACACVAAVQDGRVAGQRQVPEPWRGSLDAPILFVSSNPSLDFADDSPTLHQWNTDQARCEAYFERGFPSNGFPRTRLHTGDLSPSWVRFWASCRARAAELLDLPRAQVKPGTHFALTELVHCKSRDETGVDKAAPECIRRHWLDDPSPGSPNRGLSTLHGAALVIALGKVAHDALHIRPGKLHRDRGHRGQDVLMIALPHPNARAVPKSVRLNYKEPAWQEVVRHMAGRQ